jgi:uncharacterized protein YegP (UPF0339 family)
MLKVIIYRNKKNKKWYVKLVGKNGEKVWSNVQGYERVASALHSIKLLSKLKLPAEIIK